MSFNKCVHGEYGTVAYEGRQIVISSPVISVLIVLAYQYDRMITGETDPQSFGK